VSRRVLVLVLCAATLFINACSDNHKVGAGVDTTKRVGGNLSLGQDTTTAVTQPVFSLPPTHATIKPVATTVPGSRTQSSTQTTQVVQSFQIIAINGDNSSNTQFDPSSLSVYAGTPVHWQNHDTKARSVVEDNGAFRSPLIQPGGEWVFVPRTAGTFNYQDGTRPYAVGSLTVVAQ
jgi:plastocyanin